MSGMLHIAHEREHSEFGASGAHRWLRCTGSIVLCRGLAGVSSADAEEGTAAHLIAEMALNHGRDAETFRGDEVRVGSNTYPVTDDMIEGVQLFIDTVLADGALLGDCRIIAEHTFHLPKVHATAYGSTDAAILKAFTKLIVYDFKYGFIPVDAEENDQMKFYGIGALTLPEALCVEEVELVIVQPRSLRGEKVKRWTTTPEALLAFEGHLHDKAAEADKGGPLVAGDHCEHCTALECGACAEARKAPIAACTELLPFSPVDEGVVTAPPAPSYLTQEQLERVVDRAPIIIDWLRQCENAARAKLERGDPDAPRNFKLVEGRESNRKWADEKSLVDTGVPADILYERSIRSPAQLEKALKAAKIKFDIAPFLAPRTRGLSMVPSTDPRPAVRQAIKFTPVVSNPFTE